VLSATLGAPTGAGAALAVAGVALVAVRHPAALAAAPVMLGVATGVAIDQGASPSAAPLWGAGLLAVVPALLARRRAGAGVIAASAARILAAPGVR
jgi:hypothetical protein